MPAPALEAVLDQVLVPRRNGSEGLARVLDWLEATLHGVGPGSGAPDVWRHAFTGTPHGFELVWAAALALALAWALCLVRGRFGLAFAAAWLAPLLLLAEFELMLSPISGLWPAQQEHLVAEFRGEPDAPLLIFAAHVDTATHLGDHRTWYTWGWALGPASALALAAPIAAAARARRGRAAGRAVRLGVAGLALVPYAGMALLQSAGPHLGAPSPGALDNGGSVAALVRLAERLAARPPAGPRVRLVWLAAEEERALGSWIYASSLAPALATAVVNLEAVGASDELVWIADDGWELRRFRTPPRFLAWADAAAVEARGAGLLAPPLLAGTLTDGRSFLARGIPAVTLSSLDDGGFPRGLHSAADSRDRVSPEAVERAVDLLEAMVRRAERDPVALRAACSAEERSG